MKYFIITTRRYYKRLHKDYDRNKHFMLIKGILRLAKKNMLIRSDFYIDSKNTRKVAYIPLDKKRLIKAIEMIIEEIEIMKVKRGHEERE